MAATNYKITYFLKDGDFGWTETFWLVGDSRTIDQIAAAAPTYGPTRAGILGQSSTIAGFRVSIDPQNHQTRVGEMNLKGAFPGVGAMIDTRKTSDRIYSRIKLRADLDSGGHATRYLGGVPFGVIDNPEGPARPAAWGVLFGAFKGYILSLPRFCLKSYAPDPGFVPLPITAWAEDADPHFALITCPGAALLPKDRIRVKFVVPKWAHLNRDFTIQSLTVAGAYRVRLDRPFVAPNAAGLGTLFKLKVSYPAIVELTDTGDAKRKTGRFFEDPHGRSPAIFRT